VLTSDDVLLTSTEGDTLQSPFASRGVVMPMGTVRRWTGAETKALRQAMRLSVRDFAEHLDVAPRTVARWEARGADLTLAPDSQGLLDTAFARVPDDAKQRFAEELAAPDIRDSTVGQDAAMPSSTEGTVQLPVLIDGRPVLVPLATNADSRAADSTPV
jgi:transcriptional regulator with XRE-family HTH domain